LSTNWPFFAHHFGIQKNALTFCNANKKLFYWVNWRLILLSTDLAKRNFCSKFNIKVVLKSFVFSFFTLKGMVFVI